MVPIRGKKTVLAFHEPQRAAGILPAEEACLCRRDVGSPLRGRTFSARDSCNCAVLQRTLRRARGDAPGDAPYLGQL